MVRDALSGRADDGGFAWSGLVLTKAEMRAVDARALEAGVPGLVLMENAAAAVEASVVRVLDGVGGGGVVIVCGSGNNGGDGLAVARRLLVRGVGVRAVLAMEEGSYAGDAGVQLRAARAVGVRVEGWEDVGAGVLGGAAVAVDGLFGTGLSRGIEGTPAAVVGAVNAWRAAGGGRRVVSIDVPSGLDCDSGVPAVEGGVVVRADVTVTLGAMKVGLAGGVARGWCGEVEVGGIGVPRDNLKAYPQTR